MHHENPWYLAAIVCGLFAGVTVMFALLYRALEHPLPF